MTDWGSRALDAQKALRSDPGSWKRFLRDLQTAAGEGDANAMEALGGWLQEGLKDETGEVVAKPELKKAVGWFDRAAEHSHAGALHQLAYCYDVGLGVKQDRLQAIELYRRAVSAGQEMSALNLAICYRELGNLRAYRRWIERAARSGSVEAQLQLAEWRLTRRTTKAQKKKAIRSLRSSFVISVRQIRRGNTRTSCLARRHCWSKESRCSYRAATQRIKRPFDIETRSTAWILTRI